MGMLFREWEQQNYSEASDRPVGAACSEGGAPSPSTPKRDTHHFKKNQKNNRYRLKRWVSSIGLVLAFLTFRL